MQKLKDKMRTHTGVFPQQAHVNSEWRAVSLAESKYEPTVRYGKKTKNFRRLSTAGWSVSFSCFLFGIYFAMCVDACEFLLQDIRI